MTTQAERQFTTNSDAWEIFVGSITPQEFFAPFNSASDAIESLIADWPWDEPVPTWLRSALANYISSR